MELKKILEKSFVEKNDLERYLKLFVTVNFPLQSKFKRVSFSARDLKITFLSECPLTLCAIKYRFLTVIP